MSLKSDKQTVRDYFKAFLAKDLAWFKRYIEPGFRRHNPGLPSTCATAGFRSTGPCSTTLGCSASSASRPSYREFGSRVFCRA